MNTRQSEHPISVQEANALCEIFHFISDNNRYPFIDELSGNVSDGQPSLEILELERRGIVALNFKLKRVINNSERLICIQPDNGCDQLQLADMKFENRVLHSPLSANEAGVLQYVYNYMVRFGHSPSQREIFFACNVKAYTLLLEKGIIRKDGVSNVGGSGRRRNICICTGFGMDQLVTKVSMQPTAMIMYEHIRDKVARSKNGFTSKKQVSDKLHNGERSIRQLRDMGYIKIERGATATNDHRIYLTDVKPELMGDKTHARNITRYLNKDVSSFRKLPPLARLITDREADVFCEIYNFISDTHRYPSVAEISGNEPEGQPSLELLALEKHGILAMSYNIKSIATNSERIIRLQKNNGCDHLIFPHIKFENRMANSRLGRQQAELLQYIYNYISKFGYSPSLREMFRICSPRGYGLLLDKGIIQTGASGQSGGQKKRRNIRVSPGFGMDQLLTQTDLLPRPTIMYECIREEIAKTGQGYIKKGDLLNLLKVKDAGRHLKELAAKGYVTLVVKTGRGGHSHVYLSDKIPSLMGDKNHAPMMVSDVN